MDYYSTTFYHQTVKPDRPSESAMVGEHAMGRLVNTISIVQYSIVFSANSDIRVYVIKLFWALKWCRLRFYEDPLQEAENRSTKSTCLPNRTHIVMAIRCFDKITASTSASVSFGDFNFQRSTSHHSPSHHPHLCGTYKRTRISTFKQRKSRGPCQGQ